MRKDVSAAIGPVDDGAWAAAVAAAVDGGLAVATAGAPKAVKSAKPKDVPLVLSGDGRTAARDRLGVVADRPTLTAGTIAGFWKHRDPTPSAAAVLVTRLYVSAAKPPTHKAARKFVGDVVGPIDDGAWAAAVASVSAAGYLHDGPPAAAVAKAGKAGPLALTDAGRAAVRAWLGVPSDAAAATWKDVSAKWLPAATVPAEGPGRRSPTIRGWSACCWGGRWTWARRPRCRTRSRRPCAGTWGTPTAGRSTRWWPR